MPSVEWSWFQPLHRNRKSRGTYPSSHPSLLTAGSVAVRGALHLLAGVPHGLVHVLVRERKELLSPDSPGIWALQTRPLRAEATGAKSARLWFRPSPADTPADASRPKAGTSTASTPQRSVHAEYPAGTHATEYSARAHLVGTLQGWTAPGTLSGINSKGTCTPGRQQEYTKCPIGHHGPQSLAGFEVTTRLRAFRI